MIAGRVPGIDRAGALCALLSAVSVALLFLPLVEGPGLAPGNDTPLHVGNVVESAHLLRHRLPPWDWLPDVAGGRGGPNYLYYGSLGFVLPAFLVNLGLGPVASLKVLVAVGLVLGGLGAFLWCRHFGGALAGITGAVLFLHSPYLLNLAYVRGSYPEFLAASCYPLLFFLAWRWCAGGKASNLLAGGAVFALIVSAHTLSFILATPFVVLLGMAVARGSRRGMARSLAASVAIPALGTLLSSAFLASPFFELDKVAIAGQFSPAPANPAPDSGATGDLGAPPAQRDLYAEHGIPWYSLFNAKPVQGHPASYALPGRVHLLALGGAVVLLFVGRAGPWRRAALPHVVLCAAALLLVEQSAARITALCAPQIAYLQFPWRFLTLFNVFCASSLAATFFVAWTDRWPRIALAAAVPVASTLLSLGTMPRQEAAHFHTATREGIRRSGTTLDHEDKYMPVGATRFPSPAPDVLLEVPAGSGTVTEATTGRLNDRTYRVELPAEAEAIFRQYHFEGWRAEIDGEPIPMTREGTTGLSVLRIPGGTHDVRLFFTDTPLRRGARILSLVAWGVVVMSCVLLGIRRLRPSDRSRGSREPHRGDGG